MRSVKIKALLDTNVFIYAFEIPKSNSSFIIDALNRGFFEAVIAESVFKEVYRYFRKFYSKKVADDFRVYLFSVCNVVFSYQLSGCSWKYARLINAEDLEQVVAVRELGIKYLVSCDKHFESIEECMTPRQFAELLGIKACPVDY